MQAAYLFAFNDASTNGIVRVSDSTGVTTPETEKEKEEEEEEEEEIPSLLTERDRFRPVTRDPADPADPANPANPASPFAGTDGAPSESLAFPRTDARYALTHGVDHGIKHGIKHGPKEEGKES